MEIRTTRRSCSSWGWPLVGLSLGGALAQLVALDDPGRVASLTLITTGPAVSIGRALPDADPEYGRWCEQARVDWSVPESANARLLWLRGAGHGLQRADWDVVAPAILHHTGG